MADPSHAFEKAERTIKFCGTAIRVIGVIGGIGMVWLLFQLLLWLNTGAWQPVSLSYLLAFMGFAAPATSTVLAWPLSLEMLVVAFVCIHIVNMISIGIKRRVAKLRLAQRNGAA